MLTIHSQKFGYASVLYLKGQIVISEINKLRHAVRQHSDLGQIILDFQQVTRIDARGLGVLLELREQTESQGIEFRLKNIPRLIGGVFEISRLNSVFEILAADVMSTTVCCALAAGVVKIVTYAPEA